MLYLVIILSVLCIAGLTILGCKENAVTTKNEKEVTAKDILGNSAYQAISYGGYRKVSRDLQPSIAELKEDMKLLAALDIKFIRTYNVHRPHAANVLKAISELKKEDPSFEMYVMLGAWIDCKNAWTEMPPIHNEESDRNAVEIATAVDLANQYPDIVKVLAVGNEAMVKWATAYYVEPWIILKWVKHLQELKTNGELNKDLWITSSDNFASWGGGSGEYHVPELNELIETVDYLSIHTYPMHDTHYNNEFWLDGVEGEDKWDEIDKAMDRAVKYAQSQYNSVKSYMDSLGINKPIHIGETGWASFSGGFYGNEGSKACDEYKQSLYYERLTDWTDKEGISCFYFEAFDEIWKDAANPKGSENHFGLFTVDGMAKYVLWKEVDNGTFKGLQRGGKPITKTFEGNREKLNETVLAPPILVKTN